MLTASKTTKHEKFTLNPHEDKTHVKPTSKTQEIHKKPRNPQEATRKLQVHHKYLTSKDCEITKQFRNSATFSKLPNKFKKVSQNPQQFS